MAYLHQLWVKKADDDQLKLVFQIQNEEPVHDMASVKNLWTKAGYEVDYRTQYFYVDPGTKVGPEIDIANKKGKKHSFTIPANATIKTKGKMSTNNVQSDKTVSSSSPSTIVPVKKTKSRTTGSFRINGEDLNIKQIAQKYKMNVATVRARISSGKQGEDIVSSTTNRKQKIVYMINGEEKTIDELAKMAFVSVPGMRARLKKYNNDAEKAVLDSNGEQRGKKGKTYVVRGQELTLGEIEKQYGVKQATLRARLQRGWVSDELIDGKKKLLVSATTTAVDNQPTV